MSVKVLVFVLFVRLLNTGLLQAGDLSESLERMRVAFPVPEGIMETRGQLMVKTAEKRYTVNFIGKLSSSLKIKGREDLLELLSYARDEDIGVRCVSLFAIVKDLERRGMEINIPYDAYATPVSDPEFRRTLKTIIRSINRIPDAPKKSR